MRVPVPAAVVVDRMRAEEVPQDTLLAVWRGADTYRRRAGVRSWLFGIARRQAYQHLRLRDAPVPAELPEITDSAAGPDELAILAVGCHRYLDRVAEDAPRERR